MSEAPVEEGAILAGKYRVDQVLGEGGMGVVVAATDVHLERRVAIKFLLKEFAKHPEASERFRREARAAVKIQSEHVARVIDVGQLDTGAPYMVMEYLQGCDLAQKLDREGPLPIERAVQYILQACEAIAEAHAAGIVHRDIKPANLFLAQRADGSPTIKVLDFGISKTTLPGQNADHSLTRTASVMGSPLYMSPEQMRSTRHVDARTDIWSLGAVLYELLAGRPPYVADTMPQLCATILSDDPPPLRGLRSDVPEQLERVVALALRKDPNERYPSIAELAIALGPLGPRRSHVSVERISRVLNAAGLSKSQPELPPSLPPVDARTGAQTAASWGTTNVPEVPKNKTALAAVLGGLGIVAAGGIVALWATLSGPSNGQSAAVSSSVVNSAVATAPVREERGLASPEPAAGSKVENSTPASGDEEEANSEATELNVEAAPPKPHASSPVQVPAAPPKTPPVSRPAAPRTAPKSVGAGDTDKRETAAVRRPVAPTQPEPATARASQAAPPSESPRPPVSAPQPNRGAKSGMRRFGDRK